MAHTHEHSPACSRGDTPGHGHHGENFAARKHPEFVVLDIGEHLGALILHTDPEMHGVEVEISPDHADDRRSHKQVLERSINGRAAFTAVFDGLPAGTYALWTDGAARSCGVTVEAASVTELDWRA